ncbi:8-oxo-dGTP pyrophosphatase MutT (NUDIX family) [Symbiobacterium terraclitae]|jgi:8-oxo-dGTP pyrophosphatase MutT (NUDIX family)|uniref:8-oxo-dGTP pyrophosphatase MutT (NUDIX family) n=1 Tax=Symbiobacterium terraclitae TaxID=557451 RepID=A0ABS4JR62_9FIRM|nr:NUDIX domain-containing protein [Symbiobacterium terraclitae]MBP2018028.1 8-oxo-dGTP pyrophosphatase MutT (NUDIX family) [Symbiobacterium terraclitae]
MRLTAAWRTVVQVGYDLFLKLNPRKIAAHAVILDESGRVLLLRSRYAGAWLLPGGGLRLREHLDEGLRRECREELGVDVVVEGLSGIYYDDRSAAYVAVFRCRLPGEPIRLSHEHAEYTWAEPDLLPPGQREMIRDARRFAGTTVVARLP